jgi:hypothetical protein
MSVLLKLDVVVVRVCSWYHIWSRYQENSHWKFKEDNRNSINYFLHDNRNWTLELRLSSLNFRRLFSWQRDHIWYQEHAHTTKLYSYSVWGYDYWHFYFSSSTLKCWIRYKDIWPILSGTGVRDRIMVFRQYKPFKSLYNDAFDYILLSDKSIFWF